MQTNIIDLDIKNFRAIRKANIEINGITVVAGVNGCGKSTISKLLYCVFKVANDFDHAVSKEAFNKLQNFQNSILFLLGSMRINTQLLISLTSRFSELNLDQNNSLLKEKNILDFLTWTKEKINDIKDIQQNQIERAATIFNDIFKNEKKIRDDLNQLSSAKNWIAFIAILEKYIRNLYEKLNKDRVIKPRLYLDRELREIFNTRETPEFLEVVEHSQSIISTQNRTIQNPFSISNVIYIDTPMLLGNFEVSHWKEVNSKLSSQDNISNVLDNTIENLLVSDILNGNATIEYNQELKYFVFRTKQGVELDLKDCATGIKSFAIINFLIKNKSINDKTLLILDEPEAHLHPQWVVEYGKMLTLINKHIGTKIFVATHSPDMIQSLKYIPKKEGIERNVRFYIAKQESNLQFNFENLGEDISEIFNSFNISYDKLEQYGED